MSVQASLFPEAASSGAVFSPCGWYRYRLWRPVRGGDPARRLCYVMLNPSVADATTDDATIRVCTSFARLGGYGRLDVVNLFAYIATDPRELRQALENAVNVVGIDNDRHIGEAIAQADRVVCAWGRHGNLDGRAKTVAMRLAAMTDLWAIAFTKDGMPKHPLRNPVAKPLVVYVP